MEIKWADDDDRMPKGKCMGKNVPIILSFTKLDEMLFHCKPMMRAFTKVRIGKSEYSLNLSLIEATELRLFTLAIIKLTMHFIMRFVSLFQNMNLYSAKLLMNKFIVFLMRMYMR